MANVQLSDAIIPEVYLSYTAVDNPELTAYAESGVAVPMGMVQSAIDAPGKITEQPFWNDLDPTVEPNYDTDASTDVAVPGKINAGEMTIRKAFCNQGWSTADLVNELVGSDPMQRIRNKTGKYWQRAWQRRLLATTLGVLASNVANNASDMVANFATEDGNNATAGNIFARNAFTSAAFTLGDHYEMIQAIAMHSIVYKRAIDEDEIEFVRPSQGDMAIPRYLGRRVIVDDSMPVVAGATSGFKYTSVLFGAGAIGYATGTRSRPVEVYRRPDEGNGGGIEQLWERKKWAIHPAGFNWMEPQPGATALLGGNSPAIADLSNAIYWNRVVPRKNVPLAFIITNG